MEAYSKLFQVSMQDSALIMCIHGWNSYAKLMTQYAKNCSLVPSSSSAAQLLENHAKLERNSDEAHKFNDCMRNVKKYLEGPESGNPDPLAR